MAHSVFKTDNQQFQGHYVGQLGTETVQLTPLRRTLASSP